MAFTYDLESSDATVLRISRVRLELGDTNSSAGVRPDGSALQDAEIALWLADEGDSAMRAVAAACEALSRMWTTAATITVGPRKEELSVVARGWAERAKELRAQYGGVGAGLSFSASFTRNDGYAAAAETCL